MRTTKNTPTTVLPRPEVGATGAAGPGLPPVAEPGRSTSSGELPRRRSGRLTLAVADALQAARDERLANSTPVDNPNVCEHGYRFENALCPVVECGASPANELRDEKHHELAHEDVDRAALALIFSVLFVAGLALIAAASGNLRHLVMSIPVTPTPNGLPLLVLLVLVVLSWRRVLIRRRVHRDVDLAMVRAARVMQDRGADR